ncbi:guanine-1-methyltransferase-domain-containing protein [Aspergillus varians]
MWGLLCGNPQLFFERPRLICYYPSILSLSRIFTMEEEERPRKIQRLEMSEGHESEPLMSGAFEGAQDNDAAEQLQAELEADTQTNIPAVNPEKGSEEPTPATDGTEPTTQKISKRQLRRQARRDQWESERESRKVIRKQKNAEKKERKRAAWDEANQQGKNPSEEVRKLFPKVERPKPIRLPLTLVVDCGYDDLMMEKERISLGQQLTRSYSENNKSPYNAHMVISSFDKLLKERFETVLHKTHEGWRGVHFIGEDFACAANQAHELMQGPQGGKLVGPFADKTDAKPEDGEIVYLSSDSTETLTELKPYSTYIIGGLVDKNRYKGICHKMATEKGIRTAKLPIGEYIQMASRPVLATNHVVEIMVRWLQLQDWGEAFMQTLPARKGGMLRDNGKEQGDSTPRDGDFESGSEKEAAPETVEVAEVAEPDDNSSPKEHRQSE